MLTISKGEQDPDNTEKAWEFGDKLFLYHYNSTAKKKNLTTYLDRFRNLLLRKSLTRTFEAIFLSLDRNRNIVSFLLQAGKDFKGHLIESIKKRNPHESRPSK